MLSLPFPRVYERGVMAGLVRRSPSSEKLERVEWRYPRVRREECLALIDAVGRRLGTRSRSATIERLLLLAAKYPRELAKLNKGVPWPD